MRKGLNYPPFSKLLKISFCGSNEASKKIIRIIRNFDPKLEILGPTVNKNKKGIEEVSIILKSEDRKALNNAARNVLKEFDRSKNIQIKIDVDPA
jgi:primosomal protein N'